jgi:hypothetical protein
LIARPSHIAVIERNKRPTQTIRDTKQRTSESTNQNQLPIPRHTEFSLTYRIENNQHYLLLPAPLLNRYKTELADDLSPQIDQLIDRAEKSMGRYEKRAGDLRVTVSGVQGWLVVSG